MPLRLKFHASCAALTAVAMACSGPVSALSCIKPDPTAAFARANAATEVYVAVLGTLSGGPGPRSEKTPPGTERSYIAKFAGHSLNRDGPFERIDGNVIVQEVCAADHWCADVPMGTEVLTFFQVQASGPPILTVGPCYGEFFFEPTKAQVDAIKSCFVNGCTQS